MDNQLAEIFSGLQRQLRNKKVRREGQQRVLLQELEVIQAEYAQLNTADERILQGLIKKGQSVLKELSSSPGPVSLRETGIFLRYARAATFDFKRELGGLQHFIRAYLLTAILFFGLSPQYFGFLLPLLFILPIFWGLRGVKARSKTGLTLALSLAPVAFLTAILWTRYLLYALGNYAQVVSSMKDSLGSETFAQVLILVPGFLSLFLLASSLIMCYLGYKHRALFI